MKQIREFTDKRLKSCCIHCGRGIASVNSNKDHVPSKMLLEKPYPADLPTIEICSDCNNSFSADEEYFAAFLGAVRAGTTNPDPKHFPCAHRILQSNPRLRECIEHAKSEHRASDGQTHISWNPDWPRVKNVIIKNARGHAYYELGEPILGKPDYFWAGPLASLKDSEREEFEGWTEIGRLMPWPEVGSRMFTRVIEGQDLENGWIIVQSDCYRYTETQEGLATVKMVIAEYLAAQVTWHE